MQIEYKSKQHKKCMLNNLYCINAPITQFPSSANVNIYFYPPDIRRFIQKVAYHIQPFGSCFCHKTTYLGSLLEEESFFIPQMCRKLLKQPPIGGPLGYSSLLLLQTILGKNCAQTIQYLCKCIRSNSQKRGTRVKG